MSDQHCVITGCIASNLLDRPTYIGEWKNDEQKYELTVPYARIMATRLKGKPLDAEHMETNGAIGSILHSWVDGKKWYIQALVDQSTRAGLDMVKAVAGGDGNPFPEQIGELSLSHSGLNPEGVAWVVRGARNGCTIDNISLVDGNELELIKQQEYKIDDITVPAHFPSDAPRISATFPEMQQGPSYTALRKPAQSVQYEKMEDTAPEAQPILKQVEAMQKQLAQMQQQGNAKHRNPEEERKALLKRLAELGGGGGGGPADATGNQAANTQSHNQQQYNPQQRTGDPKFDAMIDDMQNGNTNSGNTHTPYADPRDKSFEELAGVFDSKSNVLSNQVKQEAFRKLTEVAQQSKADREALAQKDLQVQTLMKKVNELQSKDAANQADLEKQRKQAATMLKRLLQKNTPQSTPAEEQELDSAVSDMSAGKTEEGLQKFMPALIRASAFCDATENIRNLQHEADSNDVGGGYRHTMQAILGIGPGSLIQASGANRGTKRAAPSSSSESASSSSNWQPKQSALPDFLAREMAEIINDPDANTDEMIVPGKFKSTRRN